MGRKNFLENREQVSVFQVEGQRAGDSKGMGRKEQHSRISFIFSLQWRLCLSHLLLLLITVHGSCNWFEGKFQGSKGVKGGKRRMQYPFLKKGCNHLADYLTLWNAVRSGTGSPFNVATVSRSNL